MEVMSTSSTYSRQGLAALYAFTPFKLIFTSPSTHGTGDSIVMTFWYPKRMRGFYCENADSQLLSKPINEIVNDKRCKRLEELWRAPLREKVVDRIYIYEEFPAIGFSLQSNKYVLIINKKLLEYFTGKASVNEARESIERSYRRRQFALAEFSYESIINTNFCRLGIVLLTHRDQCPLINVCPKAKGKSCSNFIRWSSARESYAGLYKVVSDIRIRLSEFKEKKVSVPKVLLILPYKGRPFLEILFVDPVNVLAYYDALNFLPKKFVVNMLRVEFGKTLGIRLYMTSALRIRFNDAALNEFLQDLMQDLYIQSWLQFKAYLLTIAKGLPEKRSREPLASWNKLEYMLCHKISDDARKRIIDEILNADPTYMNRAMKFIVVHTIAHMIILGLWSYLGLSSDELSYIILPSKDSSDSYDVWIFEAASGGYGFLKHLAEHREVLYNIISSALSNILSRDQQDHRNQCVVSLDSNTLSLLRNIISTTINSLRQSSSLSPQDIQDLNSVQIKLEIFLRNIEHLYNNAHVTPHNYVVNRCLADIIPGRFKEYFNKVIDKFIATFDKFDGTVGYYFIEEGCISGPFIQPFSVSCLITKPIANGIAQTSLKKPLKKPIIEWVKMARSSIDITTWVLSIDGLDDLIKALKKACERGVKIRLLLGGGVLSDNDAYNSAVNSLKKLFQELGQCIEVRLYNKGQLHAKMIIIDGVTVIEGSFNLTKSALTINIENAQVVIDPENVRERVEKFNNLWNEATTIRKPEDLKPKQ